LSKASATSENRRKQFPIRSLKSAVSSNHLETALGKKVCPLVPASHCFAAGSLVPIWTLALFFVGALFYAYWPTLIWIEQVWRAEPDYSHGYLVPPLALLLCWNRWHLFPGVMVRAGWAGMWLLGLAILMRWVGRVAFADFLDAWSLLPLIAGAVWIIVGYPAMKWSLPAIGFLFFMIPLPFQAETLLSWKLQGVATELSTIMLRVLGQPAVSEGHVIWIGDQRLLVEEACSGMRIFIGVMALAYFWAAMSNRGWRDRMVLMVAAVPLAVLMNAARIVTIGILYQQFGSPGSRLAIHDISGYLMVPLACGAVYLVKIYWERLYRQVERVTAKDFLNTNSS
jgi:exosortase